MFFLFRAKIFDWPADLTNCLTFMEDFANFGGLEKKYMEGIIPKFILDEFRSQIVG